VLRGELTGLRAQTDTDYGYRELATQVVSGRHLLTPA
jgi:hypothetical protein